MSDHGTNARYNHGCRCQSCTAAHADYNRGRGYTAAARKRNHAARTFVAGRWIAPVPDERHGKIATYTNHGCRCLSCTIAIRERRRVYNRSRRAAS